MSGYVFRLVDQKGRYPMRRAIRFFCVAFVPHVAAGMLQARDMQQLSEVLDVHVPQLMQAAHVPGFQCHARFNMLRQTDSVIMTNSVNGRAVWETVPALSNSVAGRA